MFNIDCHIDHILCNSTILKLSLVKLCQRVTCGEDEK